MFILVNDSSQFYGGCLAERIVQASLLEWKKQRQKISLVNWRIKLKSLSRVGLKGKPARKKTGIKWHMNKQYEKF